YYYHLCPYNFLRLLHPLNNGQIISSQRPLYDVAVEYWPPMKTLRNFVDSFGWRRQQQTQETI
ncbi:hypothetical protein BLA29_015489, partial [Euroglyphus maynei]